MRTNILTAFFLGLWEFHLGCTTHFNDHRLADAYDWGREWAHRLTFRHYED